MAGLGTWKLAGVLQDMLVNNKTRRIVATVQRIEDGVTWVVPSGMKDAVPVNGSQVVSAEVDEQVIVEIENGRLSLTGNATAPAVGGTYVARVVEPVDLKATNALEEAQRAHDAADAAETDAKRAAVAAESAEGSAADAANAATAAQGSASTAAANAALASSAASQAQADASTAATAAGNAAISAVSAANSASQAASDAASANRSANSALTQLSVVQDVAGTLSWISQHGTYTATADTSVVEGRVYFELRDGDYVPIVGPSGNPSQQGWYVLDVTDAVSDYLMAHLAVTSAGLWVLPSGLGSATGPQTAPGYKLLLASDGMTVYDASGAQVVKYGSSIELGGTRAFHLGNEDAYILFYDSDNDGLPDSIRIGGDNVTLGGSKKLSELLAEVAATREDLDGLEIGGRNLLVDSSTGKGWTYSSFDSEGIVYTRSTTETKEAYINARTIMFEPGQEYTLSCYAKSNGQVASLDLYKVHVSGGGSHQPNQHITLGTEWQRVTWTFTCNADSDETAYIRFDNNGSKASGTEAILYIKKPKLERGNKATDWTPAPEDVDEGIETAKTTATRYITDITDGIFVAPEGQGPNDTQTPTGWRIKDALELIKSGVSAFRVWLENGMAKVRIGEDDQSHMELDYHSMQMVDMDGNAYFQVSDLRDEDGYATLSVSFVGDGTTTAFNVYDQGYPQWTGATNVLSVSVDGVEQSSGTDYTPGNFDTVTFAVAPSSGAQIVITYKTNRAYQRHLRAFTFGNRLASSNVGMSSISFGENTTASGYYSFAQGHLSEAKGFYSHSEGCGISEGLCSHSEGGGVRSGSNSEFAYTSFDGPKALGDSSHAEGYLSTAKGICAHAEGYDTKAMGDYSHAGGNQTRAVGSNSHAEGDGTNAGGAASHAQNVGTVAASEAQTAIGKYNDNSSGNAFEIGNGTDESNRSNAFAVDWNGNVPIAGDVQDISGALRYAPIAYGSLTGMASTTITLTTAAQKLPLGGTFVGNGCSASSNGIMVEQAGTYMITGSAYLFGGYTANDIVHLTIHAGATEIADCLYRAAGTNPYQTVVTTPVVVQLAANTVVTLWSHNQVAARGTVGSRTGHGLTVVRIA